MPNFQLLWRQNIYQWTHYRKELLFLHTYFFDKDDSLFLPFWERAHSPPLTHSVRQNQPPSLCEKEMHPVYHKINKQGISFLFMRKLHIAFSFNFLFKHLNLKLSWEKNFGIHIFNLSKDKERKRRALSSLSCMRKV